jgi:CO/xanthine dehydrogenase Mo-binding subunit
MNQYIGKAMPRYDAEGQVNGRARYVDDIKVPGMKCVKVLRSPVHKGTVRALDFSRSRRVPGVVGFVTAEDIPGKNAFGRFQDMPVLAPEGRVRYKGEPIAAVVAADQDAAREALALVSLDIEEQTPVFDMFEAMRPGAPLVRPDSTSNLWVHFPPDVTELTMVKGRVEEGLAQADRVVQGRYSTGVQEHAPMETNVSVAYRDEMGRLVIHTVSQTIYAHLGMLCAILDLPMSHIRYIGGRVGGAFGSKNDIHTDHIAALAVLKFGHPVKYRLSREEDLQFTTKRGAFVLDYQTGVKKDGRLTACRIEIWHDTGAYAGMSPYGLEKCAMFAPGPYDIPHIKVVARTIFTNRPISSSMRGFSVVNGQFAAELHLNRVAEALGMDPWELRFINAWRDGDQGVSGYRVRGAGALEAMKKAADLAGIELPKRLMAMSSRGRNGQ